MLGANSVSKMTQASVVDELIADYHQSVTDDDRVRTTAVLQRLAELELSLADWEKFRIFCEEHRMFARLEVTTRQLVTGNPPEFRLYQVLAKLLVASNDFKGAQNVVHDYLVHHSETTENRWAIMDVLWSSGATAECLATIERGLAICPSDPPFRIMKCQTLHKLGKLGPARRELAYIYRLLGSDPGLWLWYANTATMIGNHREAKRSVGTLVEMLLDGRAMANSHVIFKLIDKGRINECRLILTRLDPADYPDLAEIERLFDYAREFGLHNVAERFASVLIAHSKEARIRVKVRLYRQSIAGFSPIGFIDR